MQITILGVTRPAGTHAAKKALDNDHIVIALVRQGPDALPLPLKQHPNAEKNLRVVKGDATKLDDLKEATKGSDAVLSFLGGRGSMKTTIARECTKVSTSLLVCKV
jgi:putative NADH-flavin reductase